MYLRNGQMHVSSWAAAASRQRQRRLRQQHAQVSA